MKPEISEHFKSRKPSPIRLAQIEYMKRGGDVSAINVAIGNVSLPMHPAMQKRMFGLGSEASPFKKGAVMYTASVGTKEANDAVLNIIASSGFETKGLHSQISDGGSQAMELAILGVCGEPGSNEKPLLVIDAAYSNYMLFAKRVGRRTVSITRQLQENGKFTLPKNDEIEALIKEHKPGALVVIPYDNPTGQFFGQEKLIELAKICVRYNMWMISDEAYRELYYVKGKASSIWGIGDKIVPGIEGRRISIESSSKVWNACGLRIGALVTDNLEFHEKSVAEYTANLCANEIGQYIFSALAHESHEKLQKWYGQQRAYYKKMIVEVSEEIKQLLPGVIVSSPDASIYSVIDVRKITKPDFDSAAFVNYCAREGKIGVDGKDVTLLVAPMAGFYSPKSGEKNPGKTQMRIAYVETPENMKLVPMLFCKLLKKYEGKDPAECECEEECKIRLKKKIDSVFSDD